jgi:predicted GIY-YIG superfamily endonuclease
MFWIYRIDIDKKTRYIGYTEDIDRREKQHNYLCFSAGKNKELYNNIKKLSKTKTITLTPIKTFRTKVEAKRYECFLILNDYFTKKELWQRVPRITDV